MKPSPVQLVQLTFMKVLVEVDQAVAYDIDKLRAFAAFAFDGVTFKTKFGFDQLDEDGREGTSEMFFQVALDVVVDNELKDQEGKHALSPYLIDIRAAGLVRIPLGAEKLAPPRELAAVNGAVMLWAAIREQLMNVTSRMPRGPAMLPSVNFHDLRRQPEIDAGLLAKGIEKKRTTKKAKGV